MKRIILYITISLLISLPGLAIDATMVQADSLVETIIDDAAEGDPAISAYREGDFRKAIELFEAEIKLNKEQGLESAALYYNLGNAYFRVNDLGHARLNYERAALLAPSDKDIQHNIEYVTTRIESKIIAKGSIFISDWFNAIQSLLNSDTWAILGVVFFLVFIACLATFFFSRLVFLKKVSFYTGLVVIIFVLLANIFANNQKQKLIDRNTAVIIAPSVSISASPDINSKEVFRLHAGTKVSVRKDDRNWLEIQIDDGNVGWVQRDKLEII